MRGWLANIFRKDRAIERSIETPIDMVNAVHQEEILDDDNDIDNEGSSISTTLPSKFPYATQLRLESSYMMKSKSYYCWY